MEKNVKIKTEKTEIFRRKNRKKKIREKAGKKILKEKKKKKKISQGYFRHFPCHFGNLLTWQ